MHGKSVSIVGAHFKSLWVKRSVDADRESLGNFGPAFVSDLYILGHVQAGQVLVNLQEIDRKSMVSGAANWAQNAWNQTQHKWANHVELEEFFEIFLMSCVVILVER